MLSYGLMGAYVGAGLSVGIGALGTASGVGYAAGKALKAMTRQPDSSGLVLRTMLIGQAVTETSGIFALLVSLMLLFKSVIVFCMLAIKRLSTMEFTC